MQSSELKTIRKKLELTQAQLAHLIGYSRVQVAYWEIGKYKIPKLIELVVRLLLQDTTIVKAPKSYQLNDHTYIHNDCLSAIKDIEDDSVHLIMTSPPYANQRKKQYGGINPDKYTDWFLPIADEVFRVLAGNGSFILNIKEHAERGELHPYVYELVLAMRSSGWKLIDEYIWRKTNTMPGKYPNRFRNGYERCYHFAKTTRPAMYQEAVMIPAAESSLERAKSKSTNDDVRQVSPGGFGRKMSNMLGRTLVYPDNVLTLRTSQCKSGHPATFPDSLPEWFIKLFTEPGDVVLDPFAGSGTTARVCADLQRRFIGVEIMEEYWKYAKSCMEIP